MKKAKTPKQVRAWSRWASVTGDGVLIYVFGAQIPRLHAASLTRRGEKIVRVLITIDKDANARAKGE